MPQQDNSPEMNKCSECGESFDSQLELREHEKNCKQQADRATATPKN